MSSLSYVYDDEENWRATRLRWPTSKANEIELRLKFHQLAVPDTRGCYSFGFYNLYLLMNGTPPSPHQKKKNKKKQGDIRLDVKVTFEMLYLV